MEELVYQLKATIAGTSHDLLMSYICSSALIAAAALILLILVSHFSDGKRKPCGVRDDLYRGRSRQHRLFHQ